MLQARPALNLSIALFMVTLAIMTVGLIGVYSASATVAGHEARSRDIKADGVLDNYVHHDHFYLTRQILWAGVGLVVLTLVYHIDYRIYKRFSFWILVACFILCLLVFIPGIGVDRNGSRRWINVGIGLLQPSEFARLGLIIYTARMLEDRRQHMQKFFTGALPAIAVLGLFAVIIVLEPDFGAAFVLCLLVFGMWICGEMRWFHLIGLTGGAIPALILAFILEPYRIKRFMAYLNPDDPIFRKAEGYQLHQSLIAVGSGGTWGLGLGNSMQKYHYLWGGHTDFIFAIVAEELGLIGTSGVILLYVCFVILGWKVALSSTDLFGSLVATGITLMIFLGSTINMCVVIGLLPTKGLALPFMSYGGSSLLMNLIAVGILMNIAKVQRQLGA